jgi:hypothetical protein
MLLDEVAKLFDVLHRGFRQDTVSEVENVAGPSGSTLEDILGSRLHFFPAGKQ